MPYNCYGDLYKTEIVARLNSMGCSIKNVHELNLILEEMGILKHYANGWFTTEAGVKYTIYSGPVVNAEAWHPSIVKEVYSYIMSNSH